MGELVSVIMSTYNEPLEYIKESIESILNQTWKDIEYIIVNDNPNDKEMLDFVKKYEEVNNNIIIICNEKNKGLPYSMNKAIEKSHGKYIARMDADDISFKNRIEEEILFLKKYGLDMVASNRVDIDENGSIIRENRKVVKMNKIKKVLPHVCVINHPSVLIKADILKEMRGYREFRSAEDYDLWLRLLSKEMKIGIMEKPLIYYRIRNSGMGKKDNYLQRLLTEYAQYLYRERKHSNIDSFSNEHEETFLREIGYMDKNQKNQYSCAVDNLENGLKKCNQGSYMGGIYIIKSLKNKHVRKQVKGLLIMKWYMGHKN